MKKTKSKSEIVEELIQTCTRICKISPQLIAEMHQTVHIRSVSKKQILLKEGQVASMVWFLNTGLCKSYFKREQQECTTWFMLENQLFTNYRSFITKEPSTESIIALEDCILIEIERETIYRWYQQYPEMNLIGRVFAETFFLRHDLYIQQMLFGKAEDKFNAFQRNFPDLMLRLKSKDIASYLGTSKETFSRLKNR